MDTKVEKLKLDPVTLEVIRAALPAISTEMAVDLQRTSYNMVIYEVRDFCTGLVNPKGELVSQNVGGVSHFIADLGVLITDCMKRYGESGFKPGDAIIHNHQAVAGQHLNNVAVYMPFFFEGELLMFAICRAHWIDVGGTSTGFGAGSGVADPWLEGLQLDQLKIYREGKLNEPLYRLIRDNIRFPDSSMGDMKSQMSACRLALRRLEELFHKYGREVVLASIAQIFDETEAKCRKVVQQFPDGVYEAESFLDDDGVKKGEPIRIHAKVTVKSGSMTIDLSGCAKERQAGVNSRTLAAARIAYKALTAPTDTANEGAFRALDVIIPEGSIMMARYPAVMSSWSFPLTTTVDTILRALADAIPDRVPAAHFGYMDNGIFFGVNPVSKRRFVLRITAGGGWGGRPFEDGESAACSVLQGDVRNSSIEEMEMKSPALVMTRALRRDSAGPGKYRGGAGALIHVKNLVEGRWNLAAVRRKGCPPWGLQGGKAGDVGMKRMKQKGETEFREVALSRHPVPEDTEVILSTGSGGGWGNPFERDPKDVQWDVIEDLVSREAAREQYGVALRDDLSIDEAATAHARKERRT